MLTQATFAAPPSRPPTMPNFRPSSPLSWRLPGPSLSPTSTTSPIASPSPPMRSSKKRSASLQAVLSAFGLPPNFSLRRPTRARSSFRPTPPCTSPTTLRASQSKKPRRRPGCARGRPRPPNGRPRQPKSSTGGRPSGSGLSRAQLVARQLCATKLDVSRKMPSARRSLPSRLQRTRRSSPSKLPRRPRPLSSGLSMTPRSALPSALWRCATRPNVSPRRPSLVPGTRRRRPSKPPRTRSVQ
mmetsp:Transcript_63262/g.137589  ORF Transcript_63262/g.137589 Transcript_63262/m.137589 type:complete len:242 (+) Transcript_63262:92-817(+)